MLSPLRPWIGRSGGSCSLTFSPPLSPNSAAPPCPWIGQGGVLLPSPSFPFFPLFVHLVPGLVKVLRPRISILPPLPASLPLCLSPASWLRTYRETNHRSPGTVRHSDLAAALWIGQGRGRYSLARTQLTVALAVSVSSL